MAKNPKRYEEKIMALEAIYCNDIQFSITNLGLRLTFGETSIVNGEPPSHRVAVFIPAAIIEPFRLGLEQVLEQHKKNTQAVQSRDN